MKTFFERLQELRAEQRRAIPAHPQPLYLHAPEEIETRGPEPVDKPSTSEDFEINLTLDEYIINFDIS